jgi:hypothetical protein
MSNVYRVMINDKRQMSNNKVMMCFRLSEKKQFDFLNSLQCGAKEENQIAVAEQ